MRSAVCVENAESVENEENEECGKYGVQKCGVQKTRSVKNIEELKYKRKRYKIYTCIKLVCMIKSENAMIDHFSKEYEQLVTVESNSSLVELFCLRICYCSLQLQKTMYDLALKMQ